ncbi:MAG TPA: TonB-dependent receptor plug domain-containing protein, partial [Ferruginibacter sp.]|nr:TonB-dependent receptor plug domain-containing protein [Ferruginibacter sp.]
VTVSSTDNQLRDIGITKLNPNTASTLPTTTGGIEGLIKILVGSNNELTNQYSVRGGNYDENLIYINDFEIFRPYLVRSGQQEGLSFINPELTKNITFYNGGFQAKYGDKMSSVLDIQYKQPKQFAGSIDLGLLEQGFHVEGISKKQRLTYILGARNRNTQTLLSSQETQGVYIPSSADIQGYLTYQLAEKWRLELLGTLSSTKFFFIPQSVQKTSSVVSPFFTSNIGLDIIFDGQEKDAYQTNFIGFSAINQPTKELQLKWMLSHYQDKEIENYDIGGTYLFGERDFDKGSSTYGQIVNPLGAGYYQNYGRNSLNMGIWNISHKGSYDVGIHLIQWGLTFEQRNINDKLYEFNFQDSAGYSIPQNGNVLAGYINSPANLSIQSYSGFLQDNINLTHAKKDMILQAGARYNYNSLNHQFLVSPRMQLSLKTKKNIIYKLAAGIYDQPPFYRELREPDGTINPTVKAQQSYQLVAGLEYDFKSGNRPFRLTTEAYYKRLWNVNPYDLDNLHIQYFGENDAKAYAVGVETRLYGELVKDAESWVSLGIGRTMEDINNYFYYRYTNASGEFITAQTQDQIVTDSVKETRGWMRRPTDRLITLGVYLQDYLPTNKNIRVNLNMIYGSNMPYSIPNSVQFRDALIIDPYIRVDIGFSALLLGEDSKRRSHSPFRPFKNIWASLEIFNLLDRANTISYQLIKDYANNTYAIPNRLTPRLLNVKLIARF